MSSLQPRKHKSVLQNMMLFGYLLTSKLKHIIFLSTSQLQVTGCMHLIGKLSQETPFGSKLEQQMQKAQSLAKPILRKGDESLAPSSSLDQCKQRSLEFLFRQDKSDFSKLGTSKKYCSIEKLKVYSAFAKGTLLTLGNFLQAE